jgi:hypothetical protein
MQLGAGLTVTDSLQKYVEWLGNKWSGTLPLLLAEPRGFARRIRTIAVARRVSDMATLSAKGALSRAAIQERNSAEPERRGAPVLREFLRSAKGAFFRAAIQRRNSADEKRRGAPVLREFLRRPSKRTFAESKPSTSV